ncbi:MAG: MaoC family dehydratase N-terminal domain-containing protein [Candidatus Hydrogenedentes bacterium]|nr:MaoC family dehydratase N-terminal domain-containing protein [Candidatus Hydrogenedentota bacterium]
MEISSRFAGMESAELLVELSDRRAMNYAAGVDDANPRYFDDTAPAGIGVPPMLAAALTWPMSSRFQEFWPARDFPLEVMATQVHYSEHLAFSRPMRAGETLCIRGQAVSMQQHRAGTHLIMRYTATGRLGETVFVEHIGGMLRGVTLRDGDRSLEDVAQVATVPEGAPGWEAQVHIDALAAHRYDACADIHFPIHTSRSFARAVGLPDTIYHGTATLARAVTHILNRLGGGDPSRIASIACNFTGMVPLNSGIRIVVLKETLDAGHTSVPFHVLNAAGGKAVRNGVIILNTDPDQDQKEPILA